MSLIMSNDALLFDGIEVKYEDLFRAPDKEGAVISVRVHRRVKEALQRLAKKEGLDGVSELVRYLIAGYLLGRYQLVKPEPRVITQPIYLNVNVVKGGGRQVKTGEVEVRLQIRDLIGECLDVLDKVKKGLINPKGNEYLRKLRGKVAKFMIKALKYDLKEEYEELKGIFVTLNSILGE